MCRRSVFVVCVLFASAVSYVTCTIPNANSGPSEALNAVDDSDQHGNGISWWTMANMTGMVVRRCLDQANTTQCFRAKALRALDMAINDNGDWRLNEFLTLGKNRDYHGSHERNARAGHSNDDYNDVDDENSVSGKLSELLRSRRVQFQTNLMPATNQGRRKKDKHGGMMMFSGLAMAAMYVQVVLGKITMLAAAAFVLAKIALVVSTMSSFKKHIIATGTGTTEHIVYADHAVGQADAYRRNTFRSMGQLGVVTPSPYPYEASDELRDRDIRFVDAEQ